MTVPAMKNTASENCCVYKNIKHWPPFTYRDYPSITAKSLNYFIDFLATENLSKVKKELQPWIPFCDSKCTFCYFQTEPPSNGRVDRYLLALKKSLCMYAETTYAQTSEFDEIYLGGGTPSLLSSEQLVELLSYCERHFNMRENRAIKVSGCTHNLDAEKLKSMSNYGVNQIDVGVQTFDDDIRKMLNLQNNMKEAEQTIRTARKLGLCVSVDLMYNLPGQTLEVWRKDIKKALALNVESVDCYPLDVYPDTILGKQVQLGQVPPVGDPYTEASMHLEAYALFIEAGYKPACHNRFSRIKEDFREPCFEILGTGAGFFMGYLGKYSYVDIEPVAKYIDTVNIGRLPLAKLSVSSEEDEMRKAMMNLYIRQPVNKNEFLERFGKSPEEVFKTALYKLKKKGLIEVNDREIKLTELGDLWRFNVAWEFGQKQKNRKV